MAYVKYQLLSKCLTVTPVLNPARAGSCHALGDETWHPGTKVAGSARRWRGRRDPGEWRQSLVNIRVPLRAQISFLVPDFTAGMPNNSTLAKQGGQQSLQKCPGLLQYVEISEKRTKHPARTSEQVVYSSKKSTQKAPCELSPWSRRPKTLASGQT